MSKFSDALDPLGNGFFILQHKDYDKKGFSLDLRGGQRAVRVLDRDDLIGGLGSWEYDPDTAGDLNLAFLWPNNKTGSRRIPGWAFAWPATPQGPQNATPSGKVCSMAPSPMRILPIADKDYNPDIRYEEIKVPSFPVRQGIKVWPKFPYDTFGIALTTTEEHVQTELYFPCDPRLFAVNAGGDPEMATLVCDVGTNFKVDPTRLARLHADFWVIKEPKGCIDFFKRNSIAWNIGPSACKDVRGGLVIDEPKGFTDANSTGTQTAPLPSDRVIGMVSAHASGPFAIGADNDQHLIGKDWDNRSILATHLDTNSYFKRDKFFDGPFLFEQNFPNGAIPPAPQIITPSPFKTYVHLEFDPALVHPFVCGDRIGKWRWWAETFIYSPPGEPPRIPPDLPTEFKPPKDGGKGTPVKPPPKDEGTPGRPPVETPSTFTNPKPPVGVGLEPQPPVPTVRPYDTSDGFTPYAAVTMDFAAPSFIGRPQLIQTGVPDLRNWLNPTFAAIAFLDSFAPITSRVEAFGFQQNTSWSYTQSPGKRRFVGGTSNGGMAYMPPEVDMADISNSFAPTGVSLSTTYQVAVPNVYWATGYPVPSTGSIKTGYRWGGDTTGNLTFQ